MGLPADAVFRCAAVKIVRGADSARGQSGLCNSSWFTPVFQLPRTPSLGDKVTTLYRCAECGAAWGATEGGRWMRERSADAQQPLEGVERTLITPK